MGMSPRVIRGEWDAGVCTACSPGYELMGTRGDGGLEVEGRREVLKRDGQFGKGNEVSCQINIYNTGAEFAAGFQFNSI